MEGHASPGRKRAGSRLRGPVAAVKDLRHLSPVLRRGLLWLSILGGTTSLLGACGGNEPTAVDRSGGDVRQVASVEVSPGVDTLTAVGTTVQMSARALNGAGAEVSGVTFTWSSSDESVITIDDTGMAEAVGDGEAEVTATAEEVSGSASLTVEQEVAELAFRTQPSDVEGQEPIRPAVEVELLDERGHRVTHASTVVTLSLETDPTAGRATLSGSASTDAEGGVVAFSNLSIDLPAEGYVLEATSGAGISTISDSFSVHLTFRQVSAADPPTSEGEGHTCGVTSADRAYCWGFNGHGQLGDGSTTAAEIPVAVSGGLRFAEVSAGPDHTCGLTTAEEVYCWGRNHRGQLGDGAFQDTSSPVAVDVSRLSTQTFAQVSVGLAHSCGVTTAGEVYCWGGNSNGKLGDGTFQGSSTPVAVDVSDLSGERFLAVSAGQDHTCGVSTAGEAYCWGFNGSGRLGDGTTSTRSTPVPVSTSESFAQVSAGRRHTCGVSTAGNALCWGSNTWGQLGEGTRTDRSSPVPVSGGVSFARVDAGGAHSCGVSTAGAAYCWGVNFDGQLGDGTTTDSSVPVVVQPSDPNSVSFARVTAGGRHSCGATTGREAFCWGLNGYGQLGDGSTTDSPTPIRVVQ